MKIKVVELFAGVGGFRLGLEASSEDYKTVWANQWEPSRKTQSAYECYRRNFNDNVCVNKDISLVKGDIPKHDLLVGGFPCQDYSVAATSARGIEGKKGVLWWDIRDIVENIRPSYIVLENVDRLLRSPSSQRGRDFAIILKCLNDLGYAVEWRVINAANYGFAQKRKRVFIFAAKVRTRHYKSIVNLERNEILTEHGFFADIFPAERINLRRANDFDLTEYESLVDITNSFKNHFWNSGVCIGGLGYTTELVAVEEEFTPLGAVLEKNVSENFYLTEDQLAKFKYLRGSKKIARVKPNGEEYTYSEGKMSSYDSLRMPARTMLTSEGCSNRSTHIIRDSETKCIRKLTPIECERINGFPDNWTGNGIMSERFRYFCMGNALVVGIVERIGIKIRTL